MHLVGQVSEDQFWTLPTLKYVSELTRVCALSQIPTTLEPILISYLQLENGQLNVTGENKTIIVLVLSDQSLVS